MISQPEVSNALVDCLKKIEAGSSIDQVLADYPHLASRLREVLYAAQDARQAGKGVRVPASAQIDSRRRLLMQAQELKKRQKANIFWPFLLFLNRHLGSVMVALATIVLLFIALGSTRALPGDSLYPVKIVAEKAGSSIYVGPSSLMQREENFDSRRAAEINRLIVEQRTGAVRFAGFLENSDKTGWQVAGVLLGIPSTLKQQSQALLGIYVDVNGFLDAKGVVEVKMLQPRLVSITGILETVKENVWQVNNYTVVINNISQVTGTLRPGRQVTIQAARMRDSLQVLAITVRISPSDNLETNEPIENTPQAMGTAEPTEDINRNRIPSRTPITIRTPEPSNDTHPEDQPTHESDNEDDSHKGGEKGSDKKP